MPRKNNSNNPLQVKLRAISLPRGVTPQKYFRRLLDMLQTGRPLPESWSVQLAWRNPKTHAGRSKRWQTDDFENAAYESSAGFNSIVAQAIIKKLRRL